jgi:hypothetical protein
LTQDRINTVKTMTDEKKIGIILILIGVCIPLLTLPFLSGYSKDKDIVENLYQAGIELRKSNQGNTETQPSGATEKMQRKTPDLSKLIPKRIPLRFFLVITVVFLYMGIVRIDASIRKKKESLPEEQQ